MRNYTFTPSVTLWESMLCTSHDRHFFICHASPFDLHPGHQAVPELPLARDVLVVVKNSPDQYSPSLRLSFFGLIICILRDYFPLRIPGKCTRSRRSLCSDLNFSCVYISQVFASLLPIQLRCEFAQCLPCVRYELVAFLLHKIMLSVFLALNGELRRFFC